jgi:hypothetical protein
VPSQKRSDAQLKADAFLAAYRLTASITKAAAAAKIDRTLHYRWLNSTPGYKTAFEDAHEEAAQTLEDEAIRRATEGTLEPVFYQGLKVGAVRRYADGLLQFLLRGARPDKYSQRINADINVTGTLDVAQRLNAARERALQHDPSRVEAHHGEPVKPRVS